MEINDQEGTHTDPPPVPRRSKTIVRMVLNATIGVMIVLMCYLCYPFVLGNGPKNDEDRSATKTSKVIQLDVLNGCGVKGAAATFTHYLRTNGFDVVEMKNYKTFKIAQTLVIDRVGDLASARQVAASLGISDKHIIQQLNPDYFVNVSVVIGEDFQTLRPSH